MHVESFGARLRRQRERRQISLSTVAAETKILGALLEGLERDDVSRWPSGFYRRAFIRAYATAIGLDPDQVLREFAERFPEGDAVPALAPAPDALAGEEPGRPRPTLRLMLADTHTSFLGGRLLACARSRWAAAAFDAVVLVAIGIAFWIALGDPWLPLSLTIAFYYLGAILILGNTPGVCLFAPRPAEPGGGSAWDDRASERLTAFWRLISRGGAWASNLGNRRPV